ncbi:MAG: hypothetical protein SFZ02_16930 [bacterium]|nr:hypothetical protein [bacterium]
MDDKQAIAQIKKENMQGAFIEVYKRIDQYDTHTIEAELIAQETAISEMFASWYELIEGGWTFTFTVPEA